MKESCVYSPCACEHALKLHGESLTARKRLPSRIVADSPMVLPTIVNGSAVDDGESVVFFTVYGIKFLPKGTFSYVGHTGRGEACRGSEHFNLASGARRVVTAFAQSQHQPTKDYFAMEELWSGECTLEEVRAIEQHFINKHNTRVHPRPTNGITADIDLFEGKAPLQLNVAKACKDVGMVEAAVKRVARDTALVEVRTPLVQLRIQNQLSELMLVASETAESTACARIRLHLARLEVMPPNTAISVTDIHQMFNDVNKLLHPDDGETLKEVIKARLTWFNADKRGFEYSMPALVVRVDLIAMQAALGIEGDYLPLSHKPPTPEETENRCASTDASEPEEEEEDGASEQQSKRQRTLTVAEPSVESEPLPIPSAEDIEQELRDFEAYLSPIVSPGNLNNCMSTVRPLARGEGLQYDGRYYKTPTRFMQGHHLSLRNADFHELKRKANLWLPLKEPPQRGVPEDHRWDRSRRWTWHHPFNYVIKFQNRLIQN